MSFRSLCYGWHLGRGSTWTSTFLSITETAEAGACSREFLQDGQAELRAGRRGGMSAFAPDETDRVSGRARSTAQLRSLTHVMLLVLHWSWPGELLWGVQKQWLYLSNILPRAACCPRDAARWNWITWGTHFLYRFFYIICDFSFINRCLALLAFHCAFWNRIRHLHCLQFPALFWIMCYF